jgi:predicted kinase
MRSNRKIINRYLIFVAGIPASGKTRFATELSARLQLPLICKDQIKTVLWEKLHSPADAIEEKRRFGVVAYDVCYCFAEELMKAGNSFVFESNFTPASAEILVPLIEKYGYGAVTVLLDAPMEVLHQRFVAREDTVDRHPGLLSGEHYKNFEDFKNRVESMRHFQVGENKIVVDTTEPTKVDYEPAVNDIKRMIGYREKATAL